MKKSEAKKHKLEASDTTQEILTKYNTWNDVTPEQTAQTDAKRMKALIKGL